MYYLRPTILTILAFIATPIFGDKYGYPCSTTYECNEGDRFGGFSLGGLECKSGRCECSALEDPVYNAAAGSYECQHGLFGSFGMNKSPKCEEGEECVPNSKCVKGKMKWNPFIPDYRCVCNEGYMMVSNECREVENATLGKFCGTPETGPVKLCDNRNISGKRRCQNNKCSCLSGLYPDPDADDCVTKTKYVEKYKANLTVELFEDCSNSSSDLPKFCDETANMTCIGSKCQCHRNFYYDANNGTSLECKTKKSFAEEHNITEYRVMPGFYCHTNRDCIDGLTCHKNNCSCPYPCEFVYHKSACDCGEVSATEGAGKAILVGIIGGIVIIYGWWHLIKKQMGKTKAENYTTASTEGGNNYSNSNPGSYSLQPTSNTNQSTGSTRLTSSYQPTSRSHSPSPASAPPTKHEPSDSGKPVTPSAVPSYPSSPSQPPPPYSPQAPAPYTPTYQPTSAPTDSTTVPLIYQAPTSFPDASNPSAPYPGVPSQPDSYHSGPYSGSPYSSAASQPGAPSQSGGTAGTSTGVPTTPPPAYTPNPQPVDIYQPII